MRAVTLIASQAEFLADAEFRRLRDVLVGKGASVEHLDASEPDATAMVLGTGSLFAEDRCLVLRGDVKTVEPHLPAIIAFAENPLPGTTLLIVTTSAKTLAKALGARADLIELEPPKPWETAAWVVRYAKSLGRQVRQDAAELLVDTLGTDLRELASAIETLSISGAPITPKAVAEHFQGHETALYTLLDDVLARDRPNALRNLQALLRAGDHPLVVHAALVKQFRSLAAVSGRAKHEHPSPSSLDVSPGYLRRAVKAARAWDPDAIRRAIIALAETDLALKGGFDGEETPAEIVIELLVLDLTGGGDETGSAGQPFSVALS